MIVIPKSVSPERILTNIQVCMRHKNKFQNDLTNKRAFIWLYRFYLEYLFFCEISLLPISGVIKNTVGFTNTFTKK